MLRVSILRSWLARPKWAPTTAPFLGCTAHDVESTLKEISSIYNSKSDLALPPRLVFSFLQYLFLSAVSRPRSVVLPSTSTPILRFVVIFHSSSYCTRSLFAPTFTSRFTVFRWVENTAPMITSEQERRMVGWRRPMKRRIAYSKRRSSLLTDTDRTKQAALD
jgi:hypothetical protein